MTDSINRRKFIKMTGAAGLGLGVMGSTVNVLGNVSPNRTITVAVMGVNSRGSALARGFAAQPNAEVAYICDVDDLAIKKGLEAVREGGQTKEPEGLKDFRNALEDDSLDALVIATPIHWHAPAAILALSAGKHVYVEKPCSYNPREGELLVEAANKYRRVVQMGNQRRSWPGVVEAIDILKDGVIGPAYYARCWYANRRGSIGYGKPAPVPSNLDFDLWQGPAPRREYLDNLVHYNWHWRWHWGAGELLNNGVHFIDLAKWGLDVTFPSRVTSSGGRYHWQDDQETPDTQIVSYDFPGNKTVTWEARSCNPRGIEGSSTGVSFHGPGGTLVIDRNGYSLYDNDNNEMQRSEIERDDEIDLTGPGMDLDRDHIANFIDSIHEGRKPVSDVSDVNASVHNCHLGNIAHRTGRVINCDPHNGRIIGDPQAEKLYSREYEPGWAPVV
ncbi:MAG: Gfo/Idh/MocA family oxidoreductase [Balneolaceae bacterium]